MDPALDVAAPDAPSDRGRHPWRWIALGLFFAVAIGLGVLARGTFGGWDSASTRTGWTPCGQFMIDGRVMIPASRLSYGSGGSMSIDFSALPPGRLVVHHQWFHQSTHVYVGPDHVRQRLARAPVACSIPG
jgi:hypothetical protein